MTTSLPAAKVRSDPSYRTVSTGGAGELIRTNCIGRGADCRARFTTRVHDAVRMSPRDPSARSTDLGATARLPSSRVPQDMSMDEATHAASLLVDRVAVVTGGGGGIGAGLHRRQFAFGQPQFLLCLDYRAFEFLHFDEDFFAHKYVFCLRLWLPCITNPYFEA